MNVLKSKRVINAILLVTPFVLALLSTVLLHATGVDEDNIGFALQEADSRQRTQTLKKEDFPLVIKAYGKVVAARHTTISSEVKGRIIAINPVLEQGNLVAENEWLVKVEDIEYKQILAEKEEALATAQLALFEENARQEQAAEDLESLLPEFRTPLALRQPQVLLAKARVKSAKTGIALARQRLDRTRVNAPYSGFIANRQVSLGDYVAPGDTLATLYDGEKLHVKSTLSKSQLNQLATMIKARGERFEQGISQPKRSQGESGYLDLHSLADHISVSIEDSWGTNVVKLAANEVILAATLDAQTQQQVITLTFQPDIRHLLRPKPGSSVVVKFNAGVLADVFRISKHDIPKNWLLNNKEFEESSPDRFNLPILNQFGEVTHQIVKVAYHNENDLFLRADTQENSLFWLTEISLIQVGEKRRYSNEGFYQSITRFDFGQSIAPDLEEVRHVF